MSFKTYAGLLVLMLVGLVAGTEYATNWIDIKPADSGAVAPAEGRMFWNTSSQQVNVYDANLQPVGLDGRLACDYFVYTNGTHYFAKNCSTGVVEKSGTDATVVIQYALNQRGRIFIDRGEYLLFNNNRTTLRVYSNTTIEGVYGSTILRVADNANRSILANNALFVGDKDTVDENIVIRNVVFDGNGESQGSNTAPDGDNCIICFKNLRYSTLDGVIVKNGNGFNLLWNSIPDSVEGANLPVNIGNKILNSRFIYNMGATDLVSIGGWRYGIISGITLGESKTGAGSGLTFGSLAYSSLSDILVYNRGMALTFESMGGDGVHDVVVSNVVAKNVSRGLSIWKNPLGANPKTPYSISVRNLKVIGARDHGVVVSDGYDFDLDVTVYNVTGFDGVRLVNLSGYAYVKAVVENVSRHGVIVTSNAVPVVWAPRVDIVADVRNAGEDGIFLAYVNYTKIIANVKNASKRGLRLYYDGSKPTVRRAYIIGEYIENGGQGIYLSVTDSAYVNVFALNNGWDTSLSNVYRVGLLINDAKNVEVHGSFIDNQTVPTQQYGVSRFGVNSNARFVGCVFDGNGVAPFSGFESDWTIRDCVGFATENSGTITVNSSDSVLIPHGLAGVPDVVTFSVNTSAVQPCWIAGKDSSNINITCSSAGTFDIYWYAEYKP